MPSTINDDIHSANKPPYKPQNLTTNLTINPRISQQTSHQTPNTAYNSQQTFLDKLTTQIPQNDTAMVRAGIDRPIHQHNVIEYEQCFLLITSS